MRVSARNLLLGGGFGLPGVAFGVLAAETLDAAGGVHELLLAGKEGMAGGADFYADIALVGGAGGERVTAGAMHADLAVAGMDGCFHVSSETSIKTLDSTGVRKDSARQAISCQFCGAYLSIGKSLQLEEVDQNHTKPVLLKAEN